MSSRDSLAVPAVAVPRGSDTDTPKASKQSRAVPSVVQVVVAGPQYATFSLLKSFACLLLALQFHPQGWQLRATTAKVPIGTAVAFDCNENSTRV